MPTRLCGWPGCGSPVSCRGYCVLHARARNAETRSKNKPLYNSKRWKLLRRRYLFRNPLCEWPEGCDEIATDVHHKQAIQAGGLPYSMSNLQALCHPHHSQITAREIRVRQ